MKPPKKPGRVSKPKTKKRLNVERPYCDGTMSKAEFVTFVKNALRKARWPAKYKCVAKTFVGKGVNPATGHPCKLHMCPECRGLFPQTGMAADHIISVVGVEGFINWDTFINRLFCNSDGFSALCKACHRAKSAIEARERREHNSSQQLLL
jgi:hypothetical protein